jgi:hypothetical protein
MWRDKEQRSHFDVAMWGDGIEEPEQPAPVGRKISHYPHASNTWSEQRRLPKRGTSSDTSHSPLRRTTYEESHAWCGIASHKEDINALQVVPGTVIRILRNRHTHQSP